MTDDGTVFTMIAKKRQHQISKGYDAAHDDTHVKGELAEAAAYHALSHEQRVWLDNSDLFTKANNGLGTSIYPFEPESFKAYPNDRIEELVTSAAYLVAEIRRRLRIKELQDYKNQPSKGDWIENTNW